VEGPVFTFVSVDIDIIEQMFEYSSMAPALTVNQPEPTRADVEALRHRIQAMETSTAHPGVFPVHAALSKLFPRGGLLAGAVYSLDSSASLVWSLLAEPTQKGTWCAVVGMPDLGLGAAEELGVNVDRLVLVPSPGSQWMAVLGALLDIVGVCALGSVSPPNERSLSILYGRLRERESTLLVRSGWPRVDVTLEAEHRWDGVEAGRGLLQEHHLRITATPRSGHSARVCDVVIDHTGVREASQVAPVIDIAQHRKAG
jgi:hypothetical protein